MHYKESVSLMWKKKFEDEYKVGKKKEEEKKKRKKRKKDKKRIKYESY